MTSLLSAALHYASIGWYVFPLKPPVLGDDRSGKDPLPDCVPHGWHQATIDPAVINLWWGRHPAAGIGIATGPSGLMIVDVDTSGSKQGAASLAQIEHELPATLTAHSGSGGLHLYYYRPPDLKPYSQTEALPNLDVIGNGYIIAPPSPHYSGGAYRWSDLRPVVWLPPVIPRLHVQRQLVTADQVGAPIAEGGRNNAMFRLGAALRNTGLGSDALLMALHHENKARFKPPLPDLEVQQICAKVLKYVQPTRDVAAAAILQEQFQPAAPPPNPTAAIWISEIAANPPPPIEFIPSGCDELDLLMGGGFATAQMVGIVGPPSVGKSAFVGSTCLRMQKHRPILHFTTELLKYEQTARYAAADVGFAWRDALKGHHASLIKPAVDKMKIKIVGVDNLDRANVIGQIRRESDIMYNSEGMMPIIVVDYLQILVRAAGEGMRHAVGELSMHLREIAQQLRTVLFAVLATSRAFYGGGKDKLDKIRAENDPTAYLAAAKETGDIEFDAATLLFLDVDQLAESYIKPARAAMARCRYGSIGFAGYDANLATGLWVPNPGSTLDMSKVERINKKQDARADADDMQFIDAIKRHAEKSWREQRELTGMSHDRTDAAKKRLLARGVIELAESREYDAHHRSVKRTWIKLTC